jgi:NTP pyrophosphatase (non-canonical NTP hydrolase)
MSIEQEHKEMVYDLAKNPDLILKELNARKAHLLHMIIGICGEAGELLDAVKKYTIYDKPLDLDNVYEELGDLEFYLQGFRLALSIERDDTLKDNIEKLRRRYGNSYSNEAAIARADKVS